MKRVFALVGVCALLGTVTLPASVQAKPVVATTVNVEWTLVTKNVEWTTAEGSLVIPAGAYLGVNALGNGRADILIKFSANGPVAYLDNVEWT